MGWLKVTLDFVLHFTQFDGLSPLTGYGDVQKPLQPPVGAHPSPSPSGVESAAYTAITCSYPTLEQEGWEFCNTETSRDCWLRDPRESQPQFTQYDVKTNCRQTSLEIIQWTMYRLV